MGEEHELEDLENPEQVIDEISADLGVAHNGLVDAATQVGALRDHIQSIRPTWSYLAHTSLSDPSAQQVYVSGVKSLMAFRDNVRSEQGTYASVAGLAQGLISSGSTLINATTSTASLLASPGSVPLPLPFPPPSLDQHKLCAGRLSKLDPSLGNTYRAIWEILYGTNADPVRGALYLVRQAFDHLFDKLSPDDQGRNSVFWKRKDNDKPNQVTREERLVYAATTYVKDKARAGNILASTKHMLDVYPELNKAHDRNELNEANARNVLQEMRSILEDWVNALQI